MADLGDLPSGTPPDGPQTWSARDRDAVIHRIQALMEFWGIRPEELDAPPGPGESPAPADRARPAKYRHPVSGLTWDGVGVHPEWLRAALLQEGYTVQQLRDAVDNSPAA